MWPILMTKVTTLLDVGGMRNIDLKINKENKNNILLNENSCSRKKNHNLHFHL